MPYHVIANQDGGFDVENARTNEVQNKKPFRTKAKAQAYSNALNAHSGDMQGKSGSRNNSQDRQTIREIRDLAAQIHEHTMNLEPSESDDEIEEVEEADDNAEEEAAEVDEETKSYTTNYYEALKKSKDPNVGGGVDRSKIPDADFAGKDRSYPIVKPGDVSDAASSIGRAGPNNYSTDKLKANIIRIAKRKGKAFVAELPETWKKELGMDGKSLDLSYAKSLGVVFPEGVFAVKYVGRNEIKHYPFLWGNPQQTDVELDYFTQETDFFDNYYGKSSKPLTWDHAQDRQYKGDLVIGKTVDWGDDAVGRWAQSVITISGKYRKMIDEMIEKGILGSSSDSAPQYVERESRGKSTWIKRWPWIATSLTPTPAEPRMIGSIETLKSLGIKLPEASEVTRREKSLRLTYELLRMKSN